MVLETEDVRSEIKKNRLRFERLVRAAQGVKSDRTRVQLVSQAVIFTIDHIPGVLNSPELEALLLDVSRKHHVPLAEQAVPRTTLHILSRAYMSGGHTRVTERWIEAAPAHEAHSVIITGQGTRPIPSKLREAVKKSGGKLIELEPNFPLELALELRKVSSTFETIVLNVHPNDVTPILAFGTEEFKRRVVLFNQADHLLWLGVSIADAVINLRTFTAQLNQKWRGITNTFVLPLPVQAASKHAVSSATKSERKAALGIQGDTKLVVSMASSYKFRPFAGLDFCETAYEIIRRTPDTRFLVIGPSLSEPYWREWFERSNGRIKSVGTIPNSELSKYLEAADFAVESFPLGSPTALLDCARYGLPCVSLRTPTNWYDAFEEAGVAVATASELIERVVAGLSGAVIPESSLSEIAERESGPAAFEAKLQHLKTVLPQSHSLRTFEKDTRTEPSDFEIFNNFSLLLKGRTVKGRVLDAARAVIYVYVRFAFPFGISKKLFWRLSAYGIL